MSINPELQQKLRDYIKNACKGSQNQAAKALGWSPAYISTYLKGDFKGDLAKFEASLSEAFANKNAAENLKSAVVAGTYKPTGISEGVYETIRLCHLKGGLALDG